MKGNAYIMVGSGMGTGSLVPMFGPMSFKKARQVVESNPAWGYTIASRFDVEKEFGAIDLPRTAKAIHAEFEKFIN